MAAAKYSCAIFRILGLPCTLHRVWAAIKGKIAEAHMFEEVLPVVFCAANVFGDERVGINKNATHCDAIDRKILQEII